MAESTAERGEHLLKNRTLILWRSLLIGATGAIPLPIFDDLLPQGLKRGLLLKVAQSRNVDISEAALDVLCQEEPGAARASTWTRISSGLLALRPQRLARRLVVGILLLRRADESLRVFQQATLFDHYCARHHLGAAINADKALLLRAHFAEAARVSQREAAGELWQRTSRLASRSVRALERRLLSTSQPVPEELSEAPSEPLVLIGEGSRRLLLKDVALHRYARRLCANFDARWGKQRS